MMRPSPLAGSREQVLEEEVSFLRGLLRRKEEQIRTLESELFFMKTSNSALQEQCCAAREKAYAYA